MTFPKIVHLIYIPWDKKQLLKTDFLDFDNSFYIRFQEQLGDNWVVIMWTMDKIEKFMDNK